MKIKVDFKQLTRFSHKMERYPRAVMTDTEKLLDDTGERLLAAVKRNASGRPGPNVVTGAYRSGFFLIRRPMRVGVGNHSPQTFRLEYGFFGVDSMGRVYSQPPFPHMRPALAEVQQQFRKDLRALPKKTWRNL
jgi:hypothetical protein